MSDPLSLEKSRERNDPLFFLKKNAALVSRAVKTAHLFYAIALPMALAAIEWIGERHWLVSILLYVPPQIFLLPIFLLAPAAVFFARKFLLLDLACIVLVVFIFMHPGTRTRPASRDGLFTLVTNNFGQNNHQSLLPFLNANDPDVIALQETGNVAAWRRTFPDRFVEGHGEFVFISKFPIKSAALVPDIAWLGRPVAARYEISFQNKPLVIFSVHMPTPRPDFAKLRGFSLLKEFAGRNRRRSDNRDFAESMAARIELAKKLCAVFAAEREPFVVAGDFNTPDHGCVYHIFAAQLVDAFAKSGRGFGLTFPGTTHNPLTGFGPWMRLDQAFAGRGFEPVFCEAEPARKSQHRALVAIFRRGEK